MKVSRMSAGEYRWGQLYR